MAKLIVVIDSTEGVVVGAYAAEVISPKLKKAADERGLDADVIELAATEDALLKGIEDYADIAYGDDDPGDEDDDDLFDSPDEEDEEDGDEEPPEDDV